MGYISGKSIGEWVTPALESSEGCDIDLELPSNEIINDYDVTTPVPAGSTLQFRFDNEYPLLANVEYEIKFTLQPGDIVTFFYDYDSAVSFVNTDTVAKEYKFYPRGGLFLFDPAFSYVNNGSNIRPFNLQIGFVGFIDIEIEECDGTITTDRTKQTIEKTETTVLITFPRIIDGQSYTSTVETFTYTSNVPSETPYIYPVSGKIKQVKVTTSTGTEIIEGCGCDAACGDTISIQFTQFCGDVIDVKLAGWLQSGRYVTSGDSFSASNGNEIIPVLNSFAEYDLVLENVTDSGFLYILELIRENESITISGIDYVIVKEELSPQWDSFSIYGQVIVKVRRKDTIKVTRRRCCGNETPPEEEEE
jgi:hypothetical protein